FCTSVRSRRCATRRRKVAASSSVWVLSSMLSLLASPFYVGATRRRRHSQVLAGFPDQPVDHRFERLALAGAAGERRLVDAALGVRAGAAREDGAGMGDLRRAAEMGGVLGDEGDDLLEQIGIGHDGAPAEIDESLVEAVALRAPAILVDQHA